LNFLGKICFDTLTSNIAHKPESNDFCGIYFEGRNRQINYVEDFAVVHSFKVFSRCNYPMLVLSPNPENLLNSNPIYTNVIHIKTPEYNSHDQYSQFMIKDVWNYIPKYFKRLMFFHPDGFLCKFGWENWILNNKIDFVGSAWCHLPSIDINDSGVWKNTGLPKIPVGNGGFSYRSRDICERISNTYGHLKMRESGRTDDRCPPEDLFYSHLINGTQCGKVANIQEAMQFSLDPITPEEYSKKLSFGFHYPRKNNEFQKERNYCLSL